MSKRSRPATPGSKREPICCASGRPSPIHDAHLAISLKVHVERLLIFRRRTRRRTLSSPGCLIDDFRPLKVGRPNYVRRASAMLACWKHAVGDQTADRGGANAERLGRLVERRLAAFGALALAVDGDFIVAAQGGDPRACPGI